jgi:hypothetical protein
MSHVPLTLEACLEHLVGMEHEYIVTNRGYSWTIAQLLEALHQRSPVLLTLQVYLRLPSPYQTGAIAELDEHGGFVVLYRLEERPLTTSVPGGT